MTRPRVNAAACTFAVEQEHGTLCHQRDADTKTLWSTPKRYPIVPSEEHVGSTTVSHADLVSGARTHT